MMQSTMQLEPAGPMAKALLEPPVPDEVERRRPSSSVMQMGDQEAAARAEWGCGRAEALALATEPIPMSRLPPYPPRSMGYWGEPLCGVTVVTLVCALFIAVVHGTAGSTPAARNGQDRWVKIAVALVWLEAAIALLCVVYLLLGGSGVIRRSLDTCFPMPVEVDERLRGAAGELPEGCANLPGPAGSRTLGSYCVRCLVWRPPKTGTYDAHHCNTCQRCVRGFDHHCGVFGRCIVKANMPCFHLLIAMLPAGFITAVMGMLAGATEAAVSGSSATAATD